MYTLGIESWYIWMEQYYVNEHRLNLDLNMYNCGNENCSSGHSYGPAIRDYFLIHYVESGKGIFKAGGKVYHIEADQCFLICPDEITFYKADEKNPWHYYWIGFNGAKAESYLFQSSLSARNPVFSCNDSFFRDLILDMINANTVSNAKDTKQLGLLYILISKLIESRSKDNLFCKTENRKSYYIKRCVEYIWKNYSRKISIADIAGYIGLDRSYLSSIFKDNLDISIQQFLIKYRMDKACELMRNTYLSIGEVSHSVGYDDQLLFSKVFKKVIGLSPREYRKSL